MFHGFSLHLDSSPKTKDREAKEERTVNVVGILTDDSSLLLKGN